MHSSWWSEINTTPQKSSRCVGCTIANNTNPPLSPGAVGPQHHSWRLTSPPGFTPGAVSASTWFEVLWHTYTHAHAHAHAHTHTHRNVELQKIGLLIFVKHTLSVVLECCTTHTESEGKRGKKKMLAQIALGIRTNVQIKACLSAKQDGHSERWQHSDGTCTT